MKDICLVLKQGMQVKLNHRTDTLIEVEGTFDGCEISNGEITGYNIKSDSGYLKFCSRALFKIEVLEINQKNK